MFFTYRENIDKKINLLLIEWQHGTTAEVIVVESFIEQDGFTAHIKFSPIMPLIDTVCYMWYIGTKTIEQQI